MGLAVSELISAGGTQGYLQRPVRSLAFDVRLFPCFQRHVHFETAVSVCPERFIFVRRSDKAYTNGINMWLTIPEIDNLSTDHPMTAVMDLTETRLKRKLKFLIGMSEHDEPMPERLPEPDAYEL